MHLKMRDRDYIPDGAGGFQIAEGSQRLLQQALFLLTAKRGKFTLMPELGSRLYLLPGEKPSAYSAMAKVYAQEALLPLGLTVVSADVTPESDGLHVAVHLIYNGEDMLLEVISA